MRFTKLFNSRLGYIYKSKQRIVVTRYGDDEVVASWFLILWERNHLFVTLMLREHRLRSGLPPFMYRKPTLL